MSIPTPTAEDLAEARRNLDQCRIPEYLAEHVVGWLAGVLDESGPWEPEETLRRAKAMIDAYMERVA